MKKLIQFDHIKTWLIKILLLSLLTLCALPCWADQQRVALVIGNSDYKTSPLNNPVNDATDMAKKLKKKGFRVKKLLNANQKKMELAIRDFNKSLNANSVALFYFAGHGLEIDGENYLVPVDALIEQESDVRYEAVAVGRVLEGMQRADNGLNLVVLGACPRISPAGSRYF